MIRSLMALALLTFPVFAQEGTTLSGIVKDPQGKAVAEAQMRLYRQGAGAILQTTTDPEGRYRFERLASGVFILEVEKDNFRGATTTVRIAESESGSADVVLSLAGVSQSVLVTAAGAPQQLDEVSKAVSVVTSGEIQNRNEYALSEVLRSVPGVLITNGGGPGQNTSIRIRGVRPDATAVLVDGLRFRDASTTQSDASSFVSNLNFITTERIEVLRGSGSSLYGTNAVGGVINIVTDEGGGPAHGDLQAEGGNLGLWRGRGKVSGGVLGDRLAYSAGFLHLNVTGGVDGNDATRSTGGQGMLRYSFSPRASLTGRVWASDDFAQLNTSPTASGVPAGNLPATGIIPAIPLSLEGVSVINSGGIPAFGNATFIPGRDDPDDRRASRFYTTALVFRHAPTPRTSWQASYQRVHTSRVYNYGPGGTGFQNSTRNDYLYTGDIDTLDVRGTALLASWLSVTGGYEFEHEGYKDRANNNAPGASLVDTSSTIGQNGHAAYFASQISLLNRRLQLSFSGRAQVFRLSEPEFDAKGVPTPYEGLAVKSPPRAMTGDVSAAYLIAGSNTKVRAHFGNAYRAASIYERFGGGFFNDFFTNELVFSAYGDPRLAPDRYNSVDAGIDQYLFQDRLRLSATMFYTRVVSITAFANAIDGTTDPFGRFYGYVNGSGGISRGVEIGIEARPLRSLTINASYTHTNADLDRDITIAGFWKVLGVPTDMATLVATKQWTRRLSTNVDLFRGSKYYTSYSAGGRSRAFEFPGSTKVDATVNYRVWEHENRVARLYGKVENLFNQRIYQNGWLNPRATFVMGVGYGF
jgi:iron complex outermembrane receptor protein